jgi:hypothetical protein
MRSILALAVVLGLAAPAAAQCPGGICYPQGSGYAYGGFAAPQAYGGYPVYSTVAPYAAPAYGGYPMAPASPQGYAAPPAPSAYGSCYSSSYAGQSAYGSAYPFAAAPPIGGAYGLPPQSAGAYAAMPAYSLPYGLAPQSAGAYAIERRPFATIDLDAYSAPAGRFAYSTAVRSPVPVRPAIRFLSPPAYKAKTKLVIR